VSSRKFTGGNALQPSTVIATRKGLLICHPWDTTTDTWSNRRVFTHSKHLSVCELTTKNGGYVCVDTTSFRFYYQPDNLRPSGVQLTPYISVLNFKKRIALFYNEKSFNTVEQDINTLRVKKINSFSTSGARYAFPLFFGSCNSFSGLLLITNACVILLNSDFVETRRLEVPHTTPTKVRFSAASETLYYGRDYILRVDRWKWEETTNDFFSFRISPKVYCRLSESGDFIVKHHSGILLYRKKVMEAFTKDNYSAHPFPGGIAIVDKIKPGHGASSKIVTIVLPPSHSTVDYYFTARQNSTK